MGGGGGGAGSAGREGHPSPTHFPVTQSISRGDHSPAPPLRFLPRPHAPIARRRGGAAARWRTRKVTSCYLIETGNYCVYPGISPVCDRAGYVGSARTVPGSERRRGDSEDRSWMR